MYLLPRIITLIKFWMNSLEHLWLKEFHANKKDTFYVERLKMLQVILYLEFSCHKGRKISKNIFCPTYYIQDIMDENVLVLDTGR